MVDVHTAIVGHDRWASRGASPPIGYEGKSIFITRAQTIRHQRLARLKRRHQRTAVLAPAKRTKEFSHAADF